MNTFAEYEAAALDTAIYPGQGSPLGLMYVASCVCGWEIHGPDDHGFLDMEECEFADPDALAI